MVIPAVKFLGLGVGFAMYHSINMAVGYAIGRFGLLGAPKEVARNPALRDGGLWMLIMSLVFMIFVEPEIDDKDETATGVKTGTQSDSQLATALEEGLAKPRTVELGEVKYETMHDAEPLHRLPSEKARHSQEPAPTASTLKMDLVLSKASLMRSQSLPRAMKDCPVRSMSVDQLEELSINASARAARQGYSNWRRGAAKGSVEISSGIVGVRSKVNKERIVRHIRDSPVLWPLYESGARATVRSHYRSMISSYQHDIGPSKATNRLTTCVEADNDPAEGSRLLETQRPQRATTKKPSEDDAGVQVKRRKFALGGIFGLFAGLLCGINMLPYVLYLEQQRSNDLSHTFDDTLSFFFSQCFGVFIAATALLALLALAARLAHIELKSPAVWPAWAAGTLWSAGFLLASVAVEDLGMAQAYTCVFVYFLQPQCPAQLRRHRPSHGISMHFLYLWRNRWKCQHRTIRRSAQPPSCWRHRHCRWRIG